MAIGADIASKNAPAEDEGPTFVEKFKTLCMIFGMLVNICLVAMGIYILVDLDGTSFFTVCYSISDGLLFCAAGSVVCYYELKGKVSPSPSFRALRFFLNKVGLAIFYFWVGALVMGGSNYQTPGQTTFGRIVGVLSWMVALGNTITVCAFEQEETEEEEPFTPTSLARKSHPSGRKSGGLEPPQFGGAGGENPFSGGSPLEPENAASGIGRDALSPSVKLGGQAV